MKRFEKYPQLNKCNEDYYEIRRGIHRDIKQPKVGDVRPLVAIKVSEMQQEVWNGEKWIKSMIPDAELSEKGVFLKREHLEEFAEKDYAIDNE